MYLGGSADLHGLLTVKETLMLKKVFLEDFDNSYLNRKSKWFIHRLFEQH
ncbi:hypothetical protein AM1_F0122 (plasmid) [Acaryochloris marina MBIC11017]|uniref:Uncharacterized protein n=1 Tax=Acaryochloris marina (strain MBIC 11017) TaxID=329726 RepID=A8ZPR5_ACAM1|nr:hypothetical protein AM1_F0122 [Acaryochloris marina MBIC11017]